MKKWMLILSLIFLMPIMAKGQSDVFTPISKYIACGDVESLSAWFAPNLEVTVFHRPNEASKNQAKQILRAFFKKYSPRSFEIMHQAGRGNMQYAVGNLSASGEYFMVTIFVFRTPESGFQIQQISIDRVA